MPVGTPGFNGARLRQAREVRGYRANELAHELSLTPQAISHYERGLKTPTPVTMTLLANFLRVPEHFFLRSNLPGPETATFFRSMAAATKLARTGAAGRQTWLAALTEYLSHYVEFPAVNVPTFDLPSDPLRLSLDDVENIAEDAREHWNVLRGPIGNMLYLLENQGVVVARESLGSPMLDSLSSIIQQRPYMLIGTDRGNAYRWRFDGAHELGHLVLHRGVPNSALLDKTQHKHMEAQAHRFASAFLMPAREFVGELFAPSLDAFRAMKPRWKVTVQAMIVRAHDLHLINDDQYERLWRGIARRGWRREEPLDASTEPERASLLGRGLHQVMLENRCAAGDITHAVSLSAYDIESLAGVPSGTLDALSLMPNLSVRPAKVLEFPFRERGVQSPISRREAGEH
jgi:Zn-dependent peptidase ImmA (M78 family)/transcriptional regulator with XRE-family HTH domain